MANIDGYLKAIMAAIHGEEVRGSIHDAIKAINTECVEGVSTTSAKAQEAAQYATASNESAEAAQGFKEEANTAAETANQHATEAEAQAELAKSYADRAFETLPEGAVVTTEDGTATGDANMYVSSSDFLKLKSHIGSIIMSTTLDTEEKVKDVYGGETWIQIKGKFLFGADENHEAASTGGSNSVTLTLEQVPAHKHTIPQLTGTAETKTLKGTFWTYGAKKILGANSSTTSSFIYMSGTGTSNTITTSAGSGTSAGTIGINATHSHTVTTDTNNTGYTGGSLEQPETAPVDITPAYMAVYIWNRTA